MKYIVNNALREYVKEELRVSIFQMAHKLAIQTGCEVLVKLEDCVDHSGCQYYATRTLNLQYIDKGLSKQPWEVMVSGVTGLPVSNHGNQYDQCRDQNGSITETDTYKLSNDGDDVKMDDSTEHPFSGSLTPGSLGNNSTMMDRLNESSGQTLVHLVKAEPGNSQLTSAADEESWTKTTVTLPFPVAIESALGSQESGTDVDAANQSMDHDQIQQQIYIYANTNTGDKDDDLDQSAMQDDFGEDQTDAQRRRTPATLNYQCTLCQKKVSSVPLLVRHAKAYHTGNESMRYHCIPCDREYKHGRHLEQHTELHSKASYRCATCCKGFYRSSTLREHELRDHQGRYRYYCPKCHKGFMRPSTMQTHLNRSHPAWFNKNKSNQIVVAKMSKSPDIVPRIVIPVNKEGEGLNSMSAVTVTEGIPSTSGDQGQTIQFAGQISGGAAGSTPNIPRMTVNEELRNQAQKKMMKVVYKCKECGRMYENANSLVRHIHDRHDSRTKLRCNQCSYRTSRTSDLARHKRAKHPIIIAVATQPNKESESDQPNNESELPNNELDL